MTVLTRNAEALKQIIDDVLDVSRITSGKLRLNVQPVVLDDILKNAVATMQPAADAKGVSFEMLVDSDALAPVSGDPDRLQQVVWNLLSNAVKFTPQGGRVRARLQRAGPSIEIVVSDDGQGIEPAFLPHVFERFRQADSRFSREHGGLGLGLAIARDLIELHGGTVSAASGGRGTGATFTVRLPPMTSAALPPDARGNVRALGLAPGRLKGVHLLIAGAEEDAMPRAVLESAGADVTTAGSPTQALELLREGRFHAVVVDLVNPEMDGPNFIARVRETLPAPVNQIPAAALTGPSGADTPGQRLAGGFQVHIAKPVNPGELVIALAALLGR
jgi:CheY-like chemotaxis protein